MREFGFLEDVSDCFESEVLVEENSLHLCVKREFGCSLATSFIDDLAEEISCQAFSAFDGEHSSYAERVCLDAVVESCVGNDEAFMVDGEVRGGVVDIVFVKVVDVLFADKDGKARFEDFVYLCRCKVGEGLDAERVSFGQGVGQCGFSSAGRGFVGELLADDVVDELAKRLEGAFACVVAVVRLVEFVQALPPLQALDGIRHDDVDDGVGFAEESTCVLLRFGVGVVDYVLRVNMLLAVSYTVDFRAFSIEFTADKVLVFVFDFCHMSLCFLRLNPNLSLDRIGFMNKKYIILCII